MIDWFASGLELIKMACIAKKNRTGFVVGFMSCIAWLVYVLIADSAHGILLVILPAMVMNVWGYIEWGRKRNNPNESPLDLIAEKREELSEQYRKVYGSKKAKDKNNLYWLPIWIGEYDKAIEKLKAGE